jgi:hypothetical protein
VRTTYDRLRGPLRLVPLEDQWGLRPDVSGSAWRIEPVEEGHPSTQALLARIWGLRDADAEVIRTEVSALGQLGPSGAGPVLRSAATRPDWRGPQWPAAESGLDEGRAGELLARLREKLDEKPAREIESTLVDQDVLARARFNEQQAEGIIELMRDGGASRDIADAIEGYLDFERAASDHVVVREIADDVAERFAPTDGCTRLHALIRETLRERGLAPRDMLWPRIATLVLLKHSAKAISVTWVALAMLAPLLLTVAGDPPPSPASETHERDGSCDLEGRTCPWPSTDPHWHVRDERINSWRQLAWDMTVWRHALDASQGSGAKASERLERLKAALGELASMLMSLGEVRPVFARVDPADRSALWLMLRDLCDDWLKQQGVTPETLPRAGSMLGTRAHALRALRRTFYAIGRCKDCGGRVVGRAERCRICDRAYDAKRQRERRARAGAKVRKAQ